MARFLVDEDLPRSLARVLADLGREASDVRDVGLRSQPDEAVMEYAVREGLTVVTGDLGFGNEVRFPPDHHRGVIVARLPN